jgi:YfiR/HmsC-like
MDRSATRCPARRRLAPPLFALALLVLLVLPGPALTQGSEAAAKARFAVTLARFVQWPVSPVGADTTPLRLCVLQNSPALSTAFAAHDGATIGSRRLSVVLHPPPAAAGCDLLFVDESGAPSATPLLAQAATHPILTIGAVDGFLAQGGMVELVNVDDTLRFDVDLKSLRRSGLGLSSQVLKLARRVRD